MLKDYFEKFYKEFQSNYNVDSSLEIFGTIKKREYTYIRRYYIEPKDKRFREIYLNFDINDNIESIVWLIRNNQDDFLTVGQLKELFGDFKSHNIIYDETTELVFTPNLNKSIYSIKTNVLEWIEKSVNEFFFFTKENVRINFDENFKVSNIVFKIKNV